MPIEKRIELKISPYMFPGIVEYEAKIKTLTIDDLPTIIKSVEEVTGVTIKNIKGPLTSTKIAVVRHVFIGISDELTNCHRSTIMEFVKRDRTTFSNSYKMYSNMKETDGQVIEWYRKIKSLLFSIYNSQ